MKSAHNVRNNLLQIISLVMLGTAFLGSGCTKGPGQIAYEVVQEWSIPNGGHGRVIVIDVKHRNEADLKKLAEQLKRSTAKDRKAFVFIYDDKKAAESRKAALESRLSGKELAYHDSHMIASYFRNAGTRQHALILTLQGVMGPTKEIKL